MNTCGFCQWPTTCHKTGDCYYTHSDLEDDDMPQPNPKAARAVADGKAPLDYLEPVANEATAWALKTGADKYGRRNFADPGTNVLLSTYVGSMLRHVTALQRGEWLDPESGQPHLAHIGANVHVVMASQEAGTLEHDTRNTICLTTGYKRGIEELAEELRANDKHHVDYTLSLPARQHRLPGMD